MVSPAVVSQNYNEIDSTKIYDSVKYFNIHEHFFTIMLQNLGLIINFAHNVR